MTRDTNRAVVLVFGLSLAIPSCTSEPGPPPGEPELVGEAGVAGGPAPEEAQEPASEAGVEAVVLPEPFASMEPGDAARRGPGGIGAARDVFHTLLAEHAKIERVVEDLPDGVRTLTTSDDPLVAGLIRLHVRQMDACLGAGLAVRRWDPIFVELARHYDRIEMVIEDVPGGVRVTETSDDPRVAMLIHQHAHRGVSEFVARGFDRAHEPTPMPEGYETP